MSSFSLEHEYTYEIWSQEMMAPSRAVKSPLTPRLKRSGGCGGPERKQSKDPSNGNPH
eukprot:gene26210-34831_t